MENKIYCCIDLKSFFASCECVERGLDPFKDNLVVADSTRKEGTICLAITPSMKALGIKNRCRVFEIPKDVEYVMAKPRMKLYMNKSLEIYSVYLKYISPNDIHVYSIDECFIDLTDYLKLYKKTPKELATLLINEVYTKTGIRASCGIGTNLFLAKLALDITAKHSKDFMGFLDVEEFKKTIWHHKPITDVWNIGEGIAKRLYKYGITDLYGVVHFPEKTLYKEFGINAELLIDHANGIEPCTIKDIKFYKSKSRSISNGQVLFSDYSFCDAEIVIKEMVENLVLELVENHLVTDSISLDIGYSDRSLKHTGGSRKISVFTDSYKKLKEEILKIYYETTDKSKTIRRINISLNDVYDETYLSYDLFSDVEKDKKERNLNKTIISIKEKFGKNSILRGINFEEKATQRERNKMIGGHNGGEDE